jgi:hypothetical protein
MKTVLGVQVPEMQDFAVTPANLEQMVTDIFTGVDSRIAAALVTIKADIATLKTAVGVLKVRFGATTVTTSSSGSATLTYGNLGFTPSVLVLTCAKSGEKGLCATIDLDTALGQTQAPINIWDVDTGAPYVGSVKIHWIARD